MTYALPQPNGVEPAVEVAVELRVDALSEVIVELGSGPFSGHVPASSVWVTERIHLALAADDWPTLTAIIAAHWYSLMNTSRETLRAAVNALPDSVLDANPVWSTARQYLNAEPASRASDEEKALLRAAASGEAGELMDTLARLTSGTAAERAHGRFQSAASMAREAIGLLGQTHESETLPLRPMLAELLAEWATSLLLAGALQEAAQIFELAHRDAVTFGLARTATDAAGSIAFIHSVRGNLQGARTWLQQLSPIALDAPSSAGATPGGSGEATVMGALAAVNVAIDELDPEAARAALARVPGDQAAPEQWALRLLVVSRFEALFGDAHAQLVRNRTAEQARVPFLSEGGLNEWALRYCDAVLLLAVNDVVAAAEAIAKIETSEAEPAAESATACNMWMLARARNETRVIAEVEQHLTHLSSVRANLEMLAVSAVCHLHSGDEERAARLFGTLAALVEEHGLVSVLTRFERRELKALAALSGVSIDAEHLRRIARTNQRMFHRLPDVQLTARERVVLRHLTGDLTLSEIAEAEHVSRNTIKSQTRSLFRKLQVASREEAVEVALRNPVLWADTGLLQ